ncbi:hypothetical protein THIOKS1850005 [Thiocapsa sp. KS1]|nr:hypothetical protein THIOKS1850005 [Thiocapsa sp. KS1]
MKSVLRPTHRRPESRGTHDQSVSGHHHDRTKILANNPNSDSIHGPTRHPPNVRRRSQVRPPCSRCRDMHATAGTTRAGCARRTRPATRTRVLMSKRTIKVHDAHRVREVSVDSLSTTDSGRKHTIRQSKEASIFRGRVALPGRFPVTETLAGLQGERTPGTEQAAAGVSINDRPPPQAEPDRTANALLAAGVGEDRSASRALLTATGAPIGRMS